jgi:hypothetical protein
MRQGPGLVLLPLLALTVVAGLFMSPSGAGAVPRPAPGASRALGDTRGLVTASNVLYHGGPVMAGQMQVYVIFWEPRGSVVSSKFNMLIKRYFRDVGDSGCMRITRSTRTAASRLRPALSWRARLWIGRPIPLSPCSRIPISGTRSRMR